MLVRSSLIAVAGLSTALAAAVPSQLFDQAVYSKLSATAALSATAWPEYTASNGSWATFDDSDWTTAFLPSTFYALNHRHTVLCPATTPSSTNGSDVDWLVLARTWSAPIFSPSLSLEEAWVHDVGFSSWVASAELALGANETAQATLMQEAEYLASRFSSIVGCTRSWDRGDGDFEVIIDNMMNLQLLVHAAEISGNGTYLEMATSHANKTLTNQIREDGSSFHVIDYSPTTGDVQWSGTAQGYSNSSTWSRGQAWGVNGFALMYNATKDITYLDTSRRMASYFVDHLPDVGVSYWDFDAPLPSTLDTSASLIASSALLLISSLESSLSNSTGAQFYSDAAVTLLSNIVEQGVTEWEGASLVGNGTVNNRADPPNNNTGIIYGDYYFIEAGNQLLSLGLANCTDGSPAVGSSSASSGSSSGGSSTVSCASSPSSSSTPSSRASHLRPPSLARWLSNARRSWMDL
ncbi:Six-hairpin glycosidase-like protein [Leucosporidium creatinivorum]|uniref:Six-hairpin glycosidase-like protein n=1 Tax=Leucosporidium creatinivorum TaxID=106004 RepID=A0A1Y2G3F5_9BASI|nr:Six-hairpin glycosidase-like protein [Leucosporidium creatinivorum]